MVMGGQRHVLDAYHREKDPVLIVQKVGWDPPEPVWAGAENLAPTPQGLATGWTARGSNPIKS